MFKLKVGLAAALLCASGVTSFAQEEPAADVTKDAVDPYNPGSERSRFLAAAGVDSELSEEEFTANLKSSDAFVRKFDSWATLRAFDRNGNRTIDWFEADGYRRAVRTAVLGAFDKDKDGSLSDAERSAANKDLAAGKLPRISLPSARPNTPDRGERPDNNTPRPQRPDNNDNPRPERPDFNSPEAQAARAERQKEMAARFETFKGDHLKQNDGNGDGKLTIEELDAARAKRFEELKESDPERYERIQEFIKRGEERRAEYIKENDKDGDGKLSEAEEQAVRDARMAQWKERDPDSFARFQERREEFEARRKEFEKPYDTDGNGELSDVERRVMEAFFRENGNRGGRDRGGDRGERGGDRGERGGDRGERGNRQRGGDQPNRGDL